MSKLEELIRDLCPDGVEFKKIKDCTLKVEKIKWDKTAGTFQYIDLSSVDSDTHSVINTTLINRDNAPSRAQQIVRNNDILFATTRPMLKKSCYIEPEFDNSVCSTGFCVLRTNSQKLNPGWLYHVIATSTFFEYVEAHQRGTSYPAISDKDLKEYQIPVPPLPVQEEIVRILDSFSDLNTEIVFKLKTELNNKAQQHIYYKQKVYFDLMEHNTELRCVGEICDLLTGFPFNSSLFTPDGTRLMRGINIKRGFLDFSEEFNQYWNNEIDFDKYSLHENDIVISMDGSLVGKSFGYVLKQHLPLLLVQRVARVRATKVEPRFLYHYISSGFFSEYVDSKKTAGAVPHISMRDIKNFSIPVPSIQKQLEIITILDRLDALCNDLTSGLSAEIAARQKQYEYYRDKLLTFPEKQ